MSIKPLSFRSIRTIPLSRRKSNVDEQDFGAPYQAGSSLSDFLCSLPNLGAGNMLFQLRDDIVNARRHKKQVVMACDAHLYEAGLSPLISRLIEQRVISGLVLTGSALLMDVEISLTGRTLRADDSHAITDETGRVINEAIDYGAAENLGMGQSVGKSLNDLELEHIDHSIVATANRYGVPLSVHPTIGADMFCLHPSAHGESMGATSMRDLQLLAGMFAQLDGGVLLNAAADATLQHVMAQALGAMLNLGKAEGNFTHAVIGTATAAAYDVEHVFARRSEALNMLAGPEEIILPLLFASVIDALGYQP